MSKVSGRTRKPQMPTSTKRKAHAPAYTISAADMRRDVERFFTAFKKNIATGVDGGIPPPRAPITIVAQDAFETKSYKFSLEAAIKVGVSFVGYYLQRSNNLTGAKTSEGGIELDYPQVITLIANWLLRAARDKLTGVIELPDFLAAPIAAVTYKAGRLLEGRKIAFVFADVQKDLTQAVASNTAHAFNRGFYQQVDTSGDPLLTGGFHPLATTVPVDYDEDKALRMFESMCTFMGCKMVKMATFKHFAGVDWTEEVDAYTPSVRSRVGDYAGCVSTKSYQLGKPPKNKLLAQMEFVEEGAVPIAKLVESGYAAQQLVGTTGAAMYHLIQHSETKEKKMLVEPAKSLMKIVPIMLNDLVKYCVAVTAESIKRNTLGTPIVLPNALEFAVAWVGFIYAQLANTSWANGGLSMPSEGGTGFNAPFTVHFDCSNLPTTTQSEGTFPYNLLECLRSLSQSVNDQIPGTGLVAIRLPTVWITPDFDAATFIRNEFAKHSVVINAAPSAYDPLAPSLWGSWNASSGLWTDGVTTKPVNITVGKLVSLAVSKVSALHSALNANLSTAQTAPRPHPFTFNRLIRIIAYEASLYKEVPYGEGTGTAYDAQVVTSLKFETGGDVDIAIRPLIPDIPMPLFPDGSFGVDQPPQDWQALFGMYEAFNRTSSGTSIDLRTKAFSRRCVGGGIVAPEDSTEFSKSIFAGLVLNCAGGGFRKLDLEEAKLLLQQAIDQKGPEGIIIKNLAEGMTKAGAGPWMQSKILTSSSLKKAIRFMKTQIRLIGLGRFAEKSVKWLIKMGEGMAGVAKDFVF